MTMRSVGFALKTDGKATVVNDFKEVKAAGQDSMSGIAEAAEQAAQRSSAATEQFTQRQMDSWKRMAAAAKTATASAYNNSVFDAAAAKPGNYGQFATVNLDRTNGAARESAAVFQAAAVEEERMAAALAKIRAAIDPLSIAQARYDAELRDASALLASGALSEKEYAAAVSLAAQQLNAAKIGLNGHSAALGLNRMQMMIGAGAAHRFADSILAGMSPMRAATMQAGDLGAILQMDDGGVAGGLAKVRALINPVTVGVAAGALAVGVAVTAWYSYSAAIGKFNTAAMGTGAILGLSGSQLEATAEAAASAGNMTVGAARDIEIAYLQIAKSGDVLAGLTALTQDYAMVTGQDTAAATRDLGAAFGDPIKGAQDLAERYGWLTNAQIENIAKMVEAGDKEGAQRTLLDAVSQASAGASDQVHGLAGAFYHLSSGLSSAYTWLGKYMDRAADDGSLFRMLPGGGLIGFANNALSGPVRQAGPVNPNALSPATIAARAQAQRLIDAYTGQAQKSALQTTLGTLRSAAATYGPGQAPAEITSGIAAYTHAIQTMIPAQQKTNELAAIDAKIAAAKTPAAKAALASERATIAAKGEVISATDLATRSTSLADAAAAHATHTNGTHAQSLARQAESMEVSAAAAIDVANAYLKSSAAGFQAEAQRKAATDATRRGISVEEQARRQLALSSAETIATSAKSVAQMNDEAAARESILAQVKSGTIAVADMDDALKLETALRPLVAARAYLHGDALEALNRVIDAQTAALKRRNAADAEFDAAGAIDKLRAAANDNRAIGALSGLSDNDRAIAEAKIRATRDATNLKVKPETRAEYLGARGDEAQSKVDADNADFLASTERAQRDQLALINAQIGAVGMSVDVHDRVVDRLQREQQLTQRLGSDYDKFAPAILAGDDAIAAANAKLKIMATAMDEVRGFGNQFVDDVLSEDAWSSWANAGKTAVHALETEFLKLALLNPLKNLINGDSALPTLTSVAKLLSGSSTASVATAIGTTGLLSGNATGTEHWSGGLTYVNEHGGEIMDLPNGTRIYPAAESQRMLAAASTASVNVNLSQTNSFAGNAVTQEDLAQIARVTYDAAVRGAQAAVAEQQKRAA